MNNDKIPTGLPLLNEKLEELGGLKQGLFSGAQLKIADIGLLKEGVDRVTQAKTILRRQELVAASTDRPSASRTVYVVYSETAGMEKGLFFVTHTLADVHFNNITGANKEQCPEPSGGRTLSEMITHLFS
jgi:hypothetical protein